MQLLQKSGTWCIVSLFKDGMKFYRKRVFDRKRNGNVKATRYSTTLVAKEVQKIAGVDFAEVSAPAGKYSKIRFMLR